MKLEPFRLIAGELSNASGGTILSPKDRAQTFSQEESQRISNRSSSYLEEDERWCEAYGVHVPDEYRRFLRELASFVALKKAKCARSSEFFESRFRRYIVAPRVLQTWRAKGHEYGYVSFASCQEFGLSASNGHDTCMYFDYEQKRLLLNAAL